MNPSSPFDGLGTHLGNLARLSNAQTRSISPENLSGEPGKGGMATEGTNAAAARDLGQGWKLSPSIDIAPGAIFDLADIQGQGAIQQIWMTVCHFKIILLRLPIGIKRCRLRHFLNCQTATISK